MSSAAIALDANILICAVLGKCVRELIRAHAATVKFFALMWRKRMVAVHGIL